MAFSETLHKPPSPRSVSNRVTLTRAIRSVDDEVTATRLPAIDLAFIAGKSWLMESPPLGRAATSAAQPSLSSRVRHYFRIDLLVPEYQTLLFFLRRIWLCKRRDSFANLPRNDTSRKQSNKSCVIFTSIRRQLFSATAASESARGFKARFPAMLLA